jgi:hypothetical protein
MKIGIIGKGNIGGVLGRRWTAAGHQIMFGVRDTSASDVEELLGAISGSATLGTPREAAAFGDVVVLAVPGAVAIEVAGNLGDLKGKPLIDANNWFGPPQEKSLAEAIQKAAPTAKVVKAFNHMGWDTIENPDFNESNASAFVAGDDPAARGTVMELAAQLGLDPVDAGPLVHARHLEAMGVLWVRMMQAASDRGFSYRIVRR